MYGYAIRFIFLLDKYFVSGIYSHSVVCHSSKRAMYGMLILKPVYWTTTMRLRKFQNKKKTNCKVHWKILYFLQYVFFVETSFFRRDKLEKKSHLVRTVRYMKSTRTLQSIIIGSDEFKLWNFSLFILLIENFLEFNISKWLLVRTYCCIEMNKIDSNWKLKRKQFITFSLYLYFDTFCFHLQLVRMEPCG